MSIILRQETALDEAAVFALHTDAFAQKNEAKLVEKLRLSPVFIPELSIVAVENEEIVGHILFTKINIRNEAGTTSQSLALAPMAVLSKYHRKGIGSMLVRHGLEKAKELGFKSVVILGHHDYYPKFGFVPAEKWGIQSPFSVPSNVFMAIELVNGSLDGVSGVVEYAKEFGETG